MSEEERAGEVARPRVNYLTVAQTFALDHACRMLDESGWHVYLVGSALTRPNWRDVDLRCILPDDEYDTHFGGASLRAYFVSVAISDWLSARTGLPIDFQFQRMTEANEKFRGPRNAMGFFAASLYEADQQAALSDPRP